MRKRSGGPGLLFEDMQKGTHMTSTDDSLTQIELYSHPKQQGRLGNVISMWVDTHSAKIWSSLLVKGKLGGLDIKGIIINLCVDS